MRPLGARIGFKFEKETVKYRAKEKVGFYITIKKGKRGMQNFSTECVLLEWRPM